MSFPNTKVKYFLTYIQYTVLCITNEIIISSYCFISDAIKSFPEFIGWENFAILSVFAFIEILLPPNMQKKFTESKYYFSKAITIKYQCRKKNPVILWHSHKNSLKEVVTNKATKKARGRLVNLSLIYPALGGWAWCHQSYPHWKWDDSSCHGLSIIFTLYDMKIFEK